jgi:hypothetical protein
MTYPSAPELRVSSSISKMVLAFSLIVRILKDLEKGSRRGYDLSAERESAEDRCAVFFDEDCSKKAPRCSAVHRAESLREGGAVGCQEMRAAVGRSDDKLKNARPRRRARGGKIELLRSKHDVMS